MISKEMVGNPVNQGFYNQLVAIVHKNQIKTDELLSCHTTLRIGGPADYYVTAGNMEEVSSVLKLCQQEGMPCFLIGNGSNLLVSDKGYRGLVLKLSEDMIKPQFRKEKNMLYARIGAGSLLASFAKEAAKQGAAGFEFAAGIPGSIGGAIYMNAGAYGGEIKDCLKSAVLLKKNGETVRIPAEKLELSYRSSILQQINENGTDSSLVNKPPILSQTENLKNCNSGSLSDSSLQQLKGACILEAEFAFQIGSSKESLEKIAEYARLRKEKQPLEYPSAGSTFKRPKGQFAGKLIMDAGLAGMRIGGAQVSEKHCGFIINTGNANACDVIKLIDKVQRIVQEKYGILLEMEVRMLGEF